MTPATERYTLVSEGRIIGQITPEEAGMCADALRHVECLGPIVSWLDGLADSGSEATP